MGSMSCSNCKHAMDRDHVTVWCRRYPPAMAFVQVGRPSMIALPGGGNQATINGEWIMQFPAMQKTGLCGEWGSRLEDILREKARDPYGQHKIPSEGFDPDIDPHGKSDGKPL